MRLKKLFCLALSCGLALTAAMPAFAVGMDDLEVNKPVKNVILMIPDGMSSDAVTLARWYNAGEELNLDSMATGYVRTHSSDAPIADSAPAGTAMATGYKSHTGYVGVLPDVNTMPGLEPLDPSKRRAPVATILEAAQMAGKATGVIATSEIMHATPADFTSHYASRKAYDILSKQQVYQELDVVLGAGTKYFTLAGRSDGKDLLSVIQKNYQFVDTTDEMNAVTSGKLWGMFSDTALAYDWDRNTAKEPSLAEMTSKAVAILSQDEDGFFLLVEGSKIDWAAHANDPIGLLSDVLAYDEAVGVALDFAKKNGETAVISVSDHGNSGISIGNAASTGNYDKLSLDQIMGPLKKATLTGEGLEKVLNADRSNVADVMSRYYGISDLTEDEIKAVIEAKAGSMNYTVGPMIARRSYIGFTTGGHTGEDVGLYVYVPSRLDQLTGTVDNTDIAHYMAKLMNVSLENTTNKLFIPARKAFESLGATVSMDWTDSKNPILVVVKGSTEIKIPVYTNSAFVNGKEVKLDGVVVYDGIGTTYVPQSAIDLLK